MNKQWILIIGAGSDIAKSVAVKFADRGYNLYLAVREPKDLLAFAQELGARYQIQTKILRFNITETNLHYGFLSNLPIAPSGVLVAVGYVGDQLRVEKDWIKAQLIINVNFVGCVSILEACAASLKELRFIAVISSVAGDRGRRSNYLYGSAKAGLTAYLSGLRSRLSTQSIAVITIKPGVIQTKMSAGHRYPRFLVATPERAAQDIMMAIERGTPVVYTPWWWRFVMLAIKLIPEKIFMKLKL